MNNATIRPEYNTAGLPESVAARMAQKAAQSWCYVNQAGGTFYVTEVQAKAMIKHNAGGEVFAPTHLTPSSRQPK